MSQRSRGAGWLANGLLTDGIFLATCFIVITIWLLAKAINLVTRAFKQEPRSKPLWLSLLASLVGLLGVAVGYALRIPPAMEIAGAFSGVSALALVVVARSVVVEHQTLFSPPRERLTTSVMKRSWWEPPDAVK